MRFVRARPRVFFRSAALTSPVSVRLGRKISRVHVELSTPRTRGARRVHDISRIPVSDHLPAIVPRLHQSCMRQCACVCSLSPGKRCLYAPTTVTHVKRFKCHFAAASNSPQLLPGRPVALSNVAVVKIMNSTRDDMCTSVSDAGTGDRSMCVTVPSASPINRFADPSSSEGFFIRVCWVSLLPPCGC